MIEIEELTDKDVGRRVIWEVGPGIENRGQLAAWTDDTLVLALQQAGSHFLTITNEIDPQEVRWADVKNSQRQMERVDERLGI